MSAYSDAVLADLPATGSYWQMTEAAGNLTDSGGGAHTLTAFNSPVYQQPGPLAGSANYAVRFSNSAQTRFEGGTGIFEFLATASFSLECWANPLSAPSSGWFPFCKRNATVDGWDWTGHSPGAHRWAANVADTLTITAYPLSTWSYDVLTYDGSNLRLYRNGVLLNGPTASTQSIISTVAQFTVGDISGGGSALDGYLAQPAVYPGVVLTPTQILTHWTIGSSGPTYNYPVRMRGALSHA